MKTQSPSPPAWPPEATPALTQAHQHTSHSRRPSLPPLPSAQARRDWNALLGRLQLDAPPRETRILYSALYRSLVHPSDIADADGRVRGPAGRVIAAPDGRYYSTLSLWDTFRGVHPMLTLVAPERVGGTVRTFTEAPANDWRPSAGVFEAELEI